MLTLSLILAFALKLGLEGKPVQEVGEARPSHVKHPISKPLLEARQLRMLRDVIQSLEQAGTATHAAEALDAYREASQTLAREVGVSSDFDVSQAASSGPNQIPPPSKDLVRSTAVFDKLLQAAMEKYCDDSIFREALLRFASPEDQARAKEGITIIQEAPQSDQ